LIAFNYDHTTAGKLLLSICTSNSFGHKKIKEDKKLQTNKMIQLNQAPCYCPLYTTVSNTIKIIQLNWPPAKNIRLHVIITCYCPFIITPPSLSSISLMVAESPIWINSYNESMYRKNIIRQHNQFWYMQPILLPCCQKEPNWNIQRLKKKRKKKEKKEGNRKWYVEKCTEKTVQEKNRAWTT
jgi:hypothetical protein